MSGQVTKADCEHFTGPDRNGTEACGIPFCPGTNKTGRNKKLRERQEQTIKSSCPFSGEELLYVEAFSGISGDMMVAALLDLGADEEVLRRALDSLPVEGFEIAVRKVHKSGLMACSFDVELDALHENHDHDMQYLYGHVQGQPGALEHTHQAPKGTEHMHEEHAHSEYVHGEHVHSEHSHHHEHRSFSEILTIIEGADLTEGARNRAQKIFTILAEAESRAHGVPVPEVHFHEVGAVDSIVDIVAAAVCLDNLGIERVAIPVLYEGRGTVRCQHGIIPVPVPAVTWIAQASHLLLHQTAVEGELVTPTGAAIAAAIGTQQELPDQYRICAVGMGAGKRTYEGASGILRLLRLKETRPESSDGKKRTQESFVLKEEERSATLGSGKENEMADTIYKLESNIDDCTGEVLGYVMEQLFAAGARDVNYMPIYMKKNRPAYQLNVICKEDQISQLETIIFRETTTIGIRRQKMERRILRRTFQEVDTPYGTAQVKVCSSDSLHRVYPEYENAKVLAAENQVPLQDVYHAIHQACSVIRHETETEGK